MSIEIAASSPRANCTKRRFPLSFNFEEIAAVVCLALATIAFSSIYISRTIPISEGWGIYYVELIKRGFVPYRDFYYYLPPLNLLIDAIFWGLSNGQILIYRYWRLAERVFLVFLVYRLLRSKFSIPSALVACTAGVILGASSVYDLVGDYNQTALVFLAVLGNFAVGYSRAADSSARCLRMVLLGVSWSLVLLTKQSVGLAAAIAFGFAYAFLAISEKNTKWIKEVACLILGIAIPLACACIVLTAMGGFDTVSQLVLQVLQSGEAKGGMLAILFSGVISLVSKVDIDCLAAAGILLYLSMRKRVKADGGKTSRRLLAVALIVPFVVIAVFYRELVSLCLSFIAENKRASLILLLSIVASYTLGRKLVSDASCMQLLDPMTMLIPLVTIYCLVISNAFGFSANLYASNLGQTVTLLSNLCLLSSILAFAWMIYRNLVDSTPSNSALLMIASTAFASSYSGLTSSASSGAPSFVLYITAPVICCAALDARTKVERFDSIKNLVIILGLLLSCSTVMANKYMNPYSWWGTTEEPYYTKTVEVKDGLLKGFMLSDGQANTYEIVNRLIVENDDGGMVWGFPYVKIFNLMTGHIEEPGFTPVLFYDVCPDSFAEAEAASLSENPPEIVVWKDIPDCVETHELYFRDGRRLGQRKIISWMNSEVSSGNYEEVGRINGIYVYRRVGESVPSFTYFDESADNNISLTHDVE